MLSSQAICQHLPIITSWWINQAPEDCVCTYPLRLLRVVSHVDALPPTHLVPGHTVVVWTLPRKLTALEPAERATLPDPNFCELLLRRLRRGLQRSRPVGCGDRPFADLALHALAGRRCAGGDPCAEALAVDVGRAFARLEKIRGVPAAATATTCRCLGVC